MLQGSSALNSISRGQIISPRIKVTVRPGRYITNAGLTRGATMTEGNSLMAFAIINHGFNFNNRIIIAGVTGWFFGESAGMGRISSYPLSLGSSPTLTTLRPWVHEGGFIVEGNTLHYMFMTHSRNGVTFFTRIYRVGSADGISFGGETLIFTGDAGNVQMDFFPVAKNEFYLLNGQSALNSSYQDTFYVNITGVTRRLALEAFPGGGNLYNISAVRKDNYDQIFIETSPPAGDSYFPYGNNSLLYSFKSDTVNVFNKEIVVSDFADGIAYISTISSGVSYDYLTFFFNRTYQISPGGITQSIQYDHSPQVIKIDKNDISFTQILARQGAGDFNKMVIAGATNMVGSSGFEYLILDTQYNDAFYVYNGLTSLDISENIISYDNNNNDRISITLGNFK